LTKAHISDNSKILSFPDPSSIGLFAGQYNSIASPAGGCEKAISEKDKYLMKYELLCPHCGKKVKEYRNPFPTVDVIIEIASGAVDPLLGKEKQGIVLIKRKNRPYGWALPGGFVDYGESLESAALREAREETSLNVELKYQLSAYSDPARDPRKHTISVVFVARAAGKPRAADDAKDVGIFDSDSIPEPLAFDHGKILRDYFEKCSLKD
jgi:ADP-ribose pyrophosphatase YjhB (NUDIX family)